MYQGQFPGVQNPHKDNDDFTALGPTLTVQVASAVSLAAALFLGMVWFQGMSVRFMGSYHQVLELVRWFFPIAAVGLVVGAAELYRLRRVGFWLTMLFSVAAGLVSGVWLVYHLVNNFYSFAQMLALPLCASAALVTPFALGAVNRATALRLRLEAEGLRVGL